jgi:zinc protease
MARYFLIIFLLGQMLMATTINYIEVKGVKIPLIFEQDKRLPIVSMQLVFTGSGSAVDDQPGLSRLSAKMMNEGTKALGSVGFASALDAKAIHLSAVSGAETFVIEFGSLKEEFDAGIELFSSLLKDPNLNARTLKKVKTDIEGRLSAKENNYDYVASNLLKSLLFSGTPLEFPADGTQHSVEGITLRDTQTFLREHLVLSNLIIVMGGDISLKTAKAKAVALADDLAVGKVSELHHYTASTQQREKVEHKPTDQAYLYFGSPYNMRLGDKDYYKARVATYILGAGGFGSRLMEEIRVKKGLAYSAYASLHVNKSNSYLSGYLQTKTESLDDALSTVKEVYKTFVQKGVTQKELNGAKRFLLGSEPLRVETLSQKLSRAFLEYYKGEKPGYAQRELEKIKDLKLSDLNSFIKKHPEILELSYAVVTK